MSLLNFPPEVTFQFLQKINLFDRINLYMTHTRLLPLCFDKLLDKHSRETLTLNELRQLYEQSGTEIERNQCFKTKVLDRLRIKNFNELVHMSMDFKNEQFLSNGKILHSLGGKLVLEREKFSEAFIGQFLRLLKRVEGTLLLAIVDVEPLDKENSKRCARILSDKLKSGQRVYIMEDTKAVIVELELAYNFARCIRNCMKIPFTAFYNSESLSDIIREYYLFVDKRNSVANIEEMIDMLDEERFIEAKQHLGSVLSLVDAAELSGGGRDIHCDNCGAWKRSTFAGIMFCMEYPDWTDCTGCELK